MFRLIEPVLSRREYVLPRYSRTTVAAADGTLRSRIHRQVCLPHEQRQFTRVAEELASSHNSAVRHGVGTCSARLRDKPSYFRSSATPWCIDTCTASVQGSC